MLQPTMLLQAYHVMLQPTMLLQAYHVTARAQNKLNNMRTTDAQHSTEHQSYSEPIAMLILTPRITVEWNH